MLINQTLKMITRIVGIYNFLNLFIASTNLKQRYYPIFAY